MYKVNSPMAGFDRPEPGKERFFKFKVMATYSTKRTADFPAKYRVYPWPPETEKAWTHHTSSIHHEYPRMFEHGFDYYYYDDDDDSLDGGHLRKPRASS